MSVKDDLKRRYGSTKETKTGLYPTATAAATAAASGAGQRSTGSSPVRENVQPRKNYSIKGAALLREKYGQDTSAASVQRYRERLQQTRKRDAEAGLRRFREENPGAGGTEAAPGSQGYWLNPGSTAGLGLLKMIHDYRKAASYYREDTSYREPNDKWQEDWLEEFGVRYNSDPESAYSFAQEVNNYINAGELAQQEGRYKEWAAEHPFLSTGVSLLTAPAGILDAADKAAEYLGRGTITQRSDVTPGAVSRTLSGGLAEHLNEVGGTLDESIPVFGGKGWGDVYSLGHSALQSLLLGNTIGGTGTLATYFSQSFSSGVEEIKARGGSDEQALAYGLISGAAEVAAEKIPLDNLLAGGDGARHTLRSWMKNCLKQAGMEGTEEVLTSLANAAADQIVMGDKSNFYVRVRELMAQGISGEDAKSRAWKEYAQDVAFDFIGGAASGAGSMAVQTAGPTLYTNRQTRQTYTPEMEAQLLELAKETEEGSRPYVMAQKFSGKGKALTGGQINDLKEHYTQFMEDQELSDMVDTVRERLEAREIEDDTLADAIAKTLADQTLSRREGRALKNSAEGQELLAQMQQELELPPTPEVPNAETLGNPMLRHYEQNLRDPITAAANTQQTGENAPDLAAQDPLVPLLEEAARQEQAALQTVEPQLPPAPVEEAVDTEKSAREQASASGRSIREAAADFGDQAAAVQEMYLDGQDVEEFSAAVRAAWEMGDSGIGMDRAVASARTQGITEQQRRRAYLLGQGAARLAAQSQDTASTKKATGGTVRRKGMVKAQGGIKIDDLSKTFNDPQRSAYKLLSFCAETTGVDVVLYRGSQEQETGRFAHGEDTIYIDIDAGTNGWDATDLGAYTMMRTFSHEFVHFVEKWSASEYNNLREAVFDQMEKNGQDAESLVELAMQEQGLDFDQASREVVAEALTDILPDSQFVQTLASKHKTVFEKLKERLEEFVANLREHFKKLAGNSSREAVALKKQMGEALGYAEEIVQLFDRAAGEAVESYQASVAGKPGRVHYDGDVGGLTDAAQNYPGDNTAQGGFDGSMIKFSQRDNEKTAQAGGVKLSVRDEAAFAQHEETIVRTIDEAIANKGVLGEKYNQKRISAVPSEVAGMVNQASNGAVDISHKYLALGGSEVWHEYQRHTNPDIEQNRGQIAFTKQQFVDAIKSVYSPDFVECVFRSTDNPTQRQSFVCAKQTEQGHYVVVEAVGGKKNPHIVPVEILYVSKAKWDKWVGSGKSLGEMLFENDPKKLAALDSEFNKKNRVTAAQFASEEAIASTPHSSRFDNIVAQASESVNQKFSERDPAAQKLNTKEEQRMGKLEASEGDQKQVRRIALTDRQVLELFADEALPKDATTAERDAYRIFRERLERLRTLQADRAEAGKQYKEQQFGPEGDRAKAKEAASRMEALDKSIVKAADDILSVEQAPVMRRVIQSARDAARRKRAQHDRDLLKEYRAKRTESDGQRKYRRAVQAQVKEMQDFILHPDTKRMKLCPEFLQKPVLEFLSTIDQSSKRKLQGGAETKADQRYSIQLDALAAVLRKHTAGDLYEGFLDLPADFTAKVEVLADQARALTKEAGDEFVLNRMTAEQLHDLSQVLTSLKTIIRDANKFHGNAMFHHVSQAGEEMTAFTKKLGDWAKARGKLSAVGNMENWVFWKNVRPFAVFSRFGKAGESIRDELVEGQDKLARNTQDVVDFVKGKDGRKGAYTEKEIKEWEELRKTIRFADGSRCRLTVAQIMGLYCMAKRGQAIDHLTKGGFVVQDEQGGTRKVHMTVDDLGVFGAALTGRQRTVADKLQKFMSDQGGRWGNAVTMRRFGIRVYGEEFYYPLQTYDEKRPASIDKPEGSDLHALLNMSFTKSLTKGANNAVMVFSIFDVFADHMGAMAQYNAMALPVLDAVKWLNWSETFIDESTGFKDVKGVKTELRRVFGVPPAKRGKVKADKGYAEQFLLNLLKSYNSTSPQATPNDKLGLGMLHRYNRSQVAFNSSVVIKQPLAVFRAMQVLNPVHLAAGANPAKIKQGIEEMLKHSGIAIWKDLGFYDVNVSKGMGKLIRQDSSLLDKVTDWGMWGAEMADKLTWAVIWNGCKAQSGGNIKKTTELFNKVIYESQVVDSVLTKSEYMRDQGFTPRLFSSFRSEPVTAISPILNDVYLMEMEAQRRGGSFRSAWHKHGNHFVRSVAVYSVTGIITAVVSAAIAAWRDDDDYQTFGEKWEEAMDGAILGELNPLTKLPLIGDVAEAADALHKAATKGEDPWLTLSTLPMAEIVQYAVDGGMILHELISGEDTNYTWYGAVRKLLQAASGAAGIPAATLSREVVDTWNNIIAPMAPSLGIDVGKIRAYEHSEATEIRDAFLSSHLTEEEATEKIQAFIQEASGDEAKLKEMGFSAIKDENDIYWKLRSWEGGEGWSKYDALTQAMAAGGDITGAMDELTTHGVKEKDAREQIGEIVRDWLAEGMITEEEAKKLLVKYGEQKDGEAAERIQEWKCELETGIPFGGIKEAYLEDEITEAEAKQMYMKYGGYSERKAEETVTEWKAEYDTGTAFGDTRDAYVDGEMTADTARNVLQTYGGYSKAEAESKVLQWQCEKDTGIRYEDVQQLYVDGRMTAERAKELRVQYGESSLEDARKEVLKWDCEKDNGVKYSDIDVAYLSGDITEETAIDWLVKYGEKDQEDAELAVQAYRWKDEHTEYKDLSNTAIDRYIDFCEGAGVSIPDFYAANKRVSEIREAGGSTKDNVVRYIRSLPLSRSQKWAMWYAVKTKSWKDNVSF